MSSSMSVFALLPVIFAAASFASPLLHARQNTTTPCAGLGEFAYDNASNFTLNAYNLTLPNANSSGAPIVLGPGPPSDSAAAGLAVLATYASYPNNDFPGPNMSLVNGSLLPALRGGLAAYGFNISAGSEVEFFVINPEPSPSPAPNYCVVASLLRPFLRAVILICITSPATRRSC
ncbi:hypothetical protein AcV7_004820 [Taiwanofungus camphoratus]|nr:hypothetical protein AcV7_004820 [Antrodia cinnamomea]